MLIGFVPDIFLKAGAIAPTLTVTEFHLTNNNTHPNFVNNSSPKGSIKWTTTGLSAGSYQAKVYFADSADAGFLNSEQPKISALQHCWCLTGETDTCTITASGGSVMGDFLWYPMGSEPTLGGYVKGAVQVEIFDSGWTSVFTSPWYDVHQDWTIEEPFMDTDANLMLNYAWSPLDVLPDLGEDNNKYEAEIYVWPGWNAVPDPYSVNDCWIMTVPYVAEEDITNDTWQFVTREYGFFKNALYPAFSGTAPALSEGDKVTLGIEIYSDYGATLVKQAPVVRFTVGAGSAAGVKQPSVVNELWNGDPYSWNLSTDHLNYADFTKSDGSFTFDSLKIGTTTLVKDTDYTITAGGNLRIYWSCFEALGAGTHNFTLHYTGEVDGVTPVDPTLTVILRGSSVKCTPTVTVTGAESAVIDPDDYTIVWKYSNGTTASFPVPADTTLTYTAVPGDALMIGGVQYYGEATGRINFTQEQQPVNIALPQNGTVTAVPKLNGTAITGSFDVTWYKKSAVSNSADGLVSNAAIVEPTDESYTYVGSGRTSPMTAADTVLYCDVTMRGENVSKYDNIEKFPVTVGFGNKTQDVTPGVKNNINIKITNADLTEEDYTVSWYRKNNDGTYKRVSTKPSLMDLQGSVGEVYFYEITPNDYYKYSSGTTVYNWLKFKGVPLDENTTKVTVTDAAQDIEIELLPVATVTLTGTITNGARIGKDNLTFSVSQDPFAGYLRGSSYYSYGAKWNAIEITSETVGSTVTFSAQVYDFGATLKISDDTYNFRTYYKTVSAAELTAPLSFAMSSEELPSYIPLTIHHIYPDRSSDTGSRSGYLSRGSWSSYEGIFSDMAFTLTNTTKGTVIDPGLYNVTPSEVQFTDMDAIAGLIDMGDTLTLSYTVDEIAGEVAQTSDSVKVLRDYYRTGIASEDQRFDLSYKDYGRAYITAEVVWGWFRHIYAVYDSNGDLVSSEETYGSSSTSGLLAPGTYTAVVWRSVKWLSVPSKLSTLTNILNANEYQAKQFTITNGLLTSVSLGGVAEIADRTIFTEDTGFKDDSVNVVSEEWTLVTLPFEVDADIAAANPNAKYAFTVQTLFPAYGIYTTQKTLEFRSTGYHSSAESDKYISLYCDGKLVESTVKTNGKDTDILGFTLYTDKTKGTIYFYIRGVISGDFPMTVEGAIADSNNNILNSMPVGKMTVKVTAANGTLNFASDYLYTSDNGGYNGVWFYTDNGSTVDLYMDDVKIATKSANNIGLFSASFTMDNNRVGTAYLSEFRTKNGNDWTLAGEHMLYAITKKNGTETRSATAIMTCVTKNSFAPAVLNEVVVRGSGYDRLYVFSGGSTAPEIKSYYFSPYAGEEYSYQFTATVNKGDNIYTLYLSIIGQDGEEHIAELKRDGNTNKFVGSVSDEKLLFTNWSVSIKSKADITIKGDYIGDEDAFLEAYGNVKINDPKTGEEMTVTQYYQQEYDKLADTYLDEQEQYIQDRQEVLDLFLDGMKQFDDMLEGANFDYSTFDGSEESMKELMAHFGIYEGVYADIPASVWEPKHISNKVVWPNGQIIWTDETFMPYAETVGPGGRIIRATTTEEIDLQTRHLICVQYAAVLPREGVEGDEGYSYIQGIDCGEVADSIAIPIKLANNNRYNAGEALNNIVTNGGDKHFPTMSKKGIQNLGNCSNILNAIHKNVVGRNTTYSESLAGWRAKLNVGALQDDHRQQTKAEIGAQTAVDGILDSGKLSGDDLDLAKDIKNDIDAICKATETADFASAMKIMMENINIVAESLSEVKEGVEDLLEKGFKDKIKDDLKQKAIDEAKEAIEDKTGISIPTDLKEACSLLLEVYASGKLSEAEKRAVELYLKTQALAKKTKTRIPPEAGGNGKNGITGRGSGGSVRATHDPEGIIYEAVLSNPVEGATAVLYERDLGTGEVSQWNAEEYGQINPQETNGSGWYQWFVPEGEWQVRVTAPEGSGLTDNTSADNAAANLDDGSTKGWLPVMPVQLGINIPLVSTNAPTVESVELTTAYAEVKFSLYMNASELTADKFTVMQGGKTIDCAVSFVDLDNDPLDPDNKSYARTVRLTPAGGFKKGMSYTVSVAGGLTAYNDKAIAADYTSGKLTPESNTHAIEGTQITIGSNGEDYKSIADAITAINKLIKAKTADEAYNFVVSDGHVEKSAVTIPKSDIKFAITGGKFTLGSATITANSDLTLCCEVENAKAGQKITIKTAADKTLTVYGLETTSPVEFSGTNTSKLVIGTTLTAATVKTFASVTAEAGCALCVTGTVSGVGTFDGYLVLSEAAAATFTNIGTAEITLTEGVNAKGAEIMSKLTIADITDALTISVNDAQGNLSVLESGTSIITASNTKTDFTAKVTITNKDKYGNKLDAFVYSKDVRAEYAGAMTMDGRDYPNFEQAFKAVNATGNNVITLNQDITAAKFALPSKAVSLTIKSDGTPRTITLSKVSSLAPGYDFTLDEITIVSEGAKNFAINGKKNITLNSFASVPAAAVKTGNDYTITVSGDNTTLGAISGGKTTVLDIQADVTATTLSGLGTVKIADGKKLTTDGKLAFTALEGAGTLDAYNAQTLTIVSVKDTTLILNQYNKVSGKKTTLMFPKLTLTSADNMTLSIKDPEGALADVAGQSIFTLAKASTDGVVPGITLVNKDGSNTLSPVPYKKDVRAEWLDALTLMIGDEPYANYSSFEKIGEAMTEYAKTVTDAKYHIIMNTDMTVSKITLPAKAASVSIEGGSEIRTLTLVGISSIAPKSAFALNKLNVVSLTAKGAAAPLTFNCSVDGFAAISTTFTGTVLTVSSTKGVTAFMGMTFNGTAFNVKGGTANEAGFMGCSPVTTLSGFDTVYVSNDLTIKKSFTANNVVILDNADLTICEGATLTINKGKKVEGGDGATITLEKGFSPIVLNGTISDTIKFVSDETLEDQPIFKTREDLSGVYDLSGIAPDNGLTYDLLTSNGYVYLKAYTLEVNGTKYAFWNEAIAAIEALKDKTADYTITLLADFNIGGALKLPGKGKYASLTIDGNGHKLTFTGTNVTLTGPTELRDITLTSVNAKTGAEVKWNLTKSKNTLTQTGNVVLVLCTEKP